MAIIGLNTSATKKYVSDLDPAKGTPGETVFVIGTLDSRISGLLKDQMTTFDIDQEKPEGVSLKNVKVNGVAFEACRYGVKGWSNFKDDEGHEIKFETKGHYEGGKLYQVVPGDLIARIPDPIVLELYNQITGGNFLSEAEAKN